MRENAVFTLDSEVVPFESAKADNNCPCIYKITQNLFSDKGTFVVYVSEDTYYNQRSGNKYRKLC